MALLTLLIIFFIPETKGVPAEQTVRLLRLPWFWSKVAGVETLSAPAAVSMEDYFDSGVRIDFSKLNLDAAV